MVLLLCEGDLTTVVLVLLRVHIEDHTIYKITPCHIIWRNRMWEWAVMRKCVENVCYQYECEYEYEFFGVVRLVQMYECGCQCAYRYLFAVQHSHWGGLLFERHVCVPMCSPVHTTFGWKKRRQKEKNIGGGGERKWDKKTKRELRRKGEIENEEYDNNGGGWSRRKKEGEREVLMNN